jgi:hypothetical protein
MFDLTSGVWDERLGPFLLAVIVAALGLLFWALWGKAPWVYYFAPAVILCAPILALTTWIQSKGRSTFQRGHNAATMGLAMLGIGTWQILGPEKTWINVYAFLSVLFCMSWVPVTFGFVMGQGDDRHDTEEKSDHPLDKIIDGAKLDVKKISEDGPRKEWSVDHPGLTSKAVQAAGETVASLARLPVGGWRARSDPDDTARTIVTTVSEDQLRKSIPYPGPSLPGGTCADPCRIGKREDGSWLTITRPGNPAKSRPSCSVLIGGMTGSGKTEGVLCEVAELMTRRDVVIWWIDVRKGRQTVPDFLPGIEWFAETDEEAKNIARALQPVIKERAEMLGELGYREWVPECWEKHRIPYIIVHLEEATTLLESLGTAFTRGAEAVRSAGMSLSNSLQRPSASNMPTDLRSQFGIAWCFGMKTEIDAGMVLSEPTLESGAAPYAWTNKRPGYNYLEATEVDESEWAMPGRTFRLKPVELACVTAEFARCMARSDPRTAAAAGQAFRDKVVPNFDEWLREAQERHGDAVLEAARRGNARLEGMAPEPPRVELEPRPVPPTPDEAWMELDEEELLSEMGLEPDEVDQDFDFEELADAPDFPIGPRPEPGDRRYSSTERAEAFMSLLAELYRKGETEIEVAKISELFSERPEGRVTPQWTYWRLKTIEERYGLVACVLEPDGNPADPRRYTLKEGLDQVPAPDPETESDSPAYWRPEEF